MLRRLIVLLSLILVASACGGSDPSPTASAGDIDSLASESEAAPTSEPEPTATEVPEPTATPEPEPTPTPEPALAPIPDLGVGPYEVGVQTITISDRERGRRMPVDVWFPLAPGTTGELARYTFVTGDYFESTRALDVEATAASADGPFPLVVYSHGSGGIRYIHSDYTETLASYGYVVVAPDHIGNTSIERVLGNADEPAQIAVDRPLDVIRVIDAMLADDDPQTADFAGLADPERVAVTGHSFGGFTTYAVASGYENPLGSSPVDDRVDALIPIAPAVGDGGPNGLLTFERLEAIELPTLIIAATDDKTTPVDPNVETAWASSPASPHYRLELVAAEHQTFTDLCDYVEVLPQRENANPLVVDTIVTMAAEGCSDEDMDFDRAQSLTNTFAVTFLESVFRDGEMFTADTHVLPDDIIYDSK